VQLTEFEFTAEMRYGDYEDDNFILKEIALTPQEAVIEMVAGIVEKFVREENHNTAKIKAEQFIADKLNTIDWTPELFCNSWVELWSSDCQLIRVYAMKAIKAVQITDRV
jgi:hypothetical protein